MPLLRQHSIVDIQAEVRGLVDRGILGRKQRIYELCKHFKPDAWEDMERAFSEHGYLLRDCVGDLMGKEAWVSD
jgi:Domain of unknown function (DUF4327)